MIQPRLAPNQQIPAELYEALLAHRAAGEHLLWCGQPNPKRVLGQSPPTYLLLVSQFPLVASHLFTLGSRFPMLVYLFGFLCVLFLTVGIGIPFCIYREAKHTAYAISNRRLLTAVRRLNGKIVITEFAPAPHRKSRLVVLPDGSGDIVYLDPHNEAGGNRYSNPAGGTLTGIPDVREVERLLQDTFGHAPRPTGRRSGPSL